MTSKMLSCVIIPSINQARHKINTFYTSHRSRANLIWFRSNSPQQCKHYKSENVGKFIAFRELFLPIKTRVEIIKKTVGTAIYSNNPNEDKKLSKKKQNSKSEPKPGKLWTRWVVEPTFPHRA